MSQVRSSCSRWCRWTRISTCLKWQRMGKPADNSRVRARIEQWLNYIIIKDVEEYYSNSFVAHVEGRIPLRITVDHGFVFYWLFLFFASCTHYWHIKLFNSYWFSAILLHTLGSTLRMLMASGIDKVQHAKKALIPLLFVKCIKRLPFLLGKRSAHVLPTVQKCNKSVIVGAFVERIVIQFFICWPPK